jgi:hypothetical protein
MKRDVRAKFGCGVVGVLKQEVAIVITVGRLGWIDSRAATTLV